MTPTPDAQGPIFDQYLKAIEEYCVLIKQKADPEAIREGYAHFLHLVFNTEETPA